MAIFRGLNFSQASNAKVGSNAQNGHVIELIKQTVRIVPLSLVEFTSP